MSTQRTAGGKPIGIRGPRGRVFLPVLCRIPGGALPAGAVFVATGDDSVAASDAAPGPIHQKYPGPLTDTIDSARLRADLRRLAAIY